MEYSFRKQGFLIIFGITILTSVIFTSDGLDLFSYFYMFFALILLASVFIRYHTTLTEDSITYVVTWMGLTLHKKVVTPNQISHMKFKRYGWSRKGAVIHTYRGFNIRLIDFMPITIYEELDEFAIKHNIVYEKSKDYLILEKLGWQE